MTQQGTGSPVSPLPPRLLHIPYFSKQLDTILTRPTLIIGLSFGFLFSLAGTLENARLTNRNLFAVTSALVIFAISS